MKMSTHDYLTAFPAITRVLKDFPLKISSSFVLNHLPLLFRIPESVSLLGKLFFSIFSELRI